MSDPKAIRACASVSGGYVADVGGDTHPGGAVDASACVEGPLTETGHIYWKGVAGVTLANGSRDYNNLLNGQSGTSSYDFFSPTIHVGGGAGVLLTDNLKLDATISGLFSYPSIAQRDGNRVVDGRGPMGQTAGPDKNNIAGYYNPATNTIGQQNISGKGVGLDLRLQYEVLPLLQPFVGVQVAYQNYSVGTNGSLETYSTTALVGVTGTFDLLGGSGKTLPRRDPTPPLVDAVRPLDAGYR